MAKFALIFVAAIAVHGAFAAPRPKAAGAPPAETTGEASNIVINLFKDISAEIQKHVPESSKIVENAAKTSSELATSLEGIVAKWKVEADKNKEGFSTAADAVFGKVTAAIDDLKKLATPAEGSKAAELKAKFDSNLKELTTAGDKLKADFKPYFDQAQENIAAFGKFVTDGVWSFGKTVQSHVEGLAKHEGTH